MIGTRISAYEILSELGSGGMGSVYLAKCAESAAGLDEGVHVALKVIHAHLLSRPGFFKRFLREAQIGQEVQHENVVRTYDCDAIEAAGHTTHFLVMEYVEGQTLRELLTELERVPEELCRHIGVEVAKGLAAVHEAGVVHRDIKPENVLITEAHIVKVMDLGVARLQDEAIRLSQIGEFVGSVEYAAPEQFRSADGEPDGRADLHALGIVLYELATGQHPYRDEDISKVLSNILNEEPRRAGEVNPQLSPFFEELIHMLIAKDRDARFADAASVVGALESGERGAWWQARAKTLRAETKRPLRRIRVPRETALHGRDDELAKLSVLFDKAKAGDGQVLLVQGEAGIGKTRLLDEFVGRLRREGEEINFLFGSYPPGGAATGSGAFSEAYREQFGEAGLVQSLEGYLTTTPLLIPAFAALLRGDATPTGTEPLTKDSLQTVFVHATRGLAAERTTIVLIDDLHFAPQEGRALFAKLAMALPGHRVLLVGTSRHGLSEAWVADLERSRHFSRMALSRLGPKDLVALLEDAFRSERLADQLAAQVGVKSDGNPFFAFEIIQGLREGQFISQDVDGTWVSTQVIQNIRIPSSVEDLIQARMSGLDDDERNLLDVASCCGFEFDPLLVASVLGLGQIPAMQRLAKVEKRHRLVRSAGRRFVFDHHQVQESLYTGMPELLREPYHAAIAGALEAREKAAGRNPKTLDGQVCVDLCEHFFRGAVGESALRYLDAALDHLDAGYLNDQMIVLADRALEVNGLLEGTARVDLLLRKNVRLGRLGKSDAQEAVLSEARALAEEDGRPSAHAPVELATGLLLLHTGRYEESLPHCERARAFYAELGDRKGEADARSGVGNALRWLSRYGEARTQHEQALAIRREIGDHAGEAASTGNLGNLFYLLGQYEEAWAQFGRALELAREIGNPYVEAIATENLGNVLAAQGRYADARARLKRAIEISREIGSRSTEALTTGNLANALAAEGRSQESLEQCGRALSLAREMGNRSSEAYSLMIKGDCWARLGAWDRAQARRHAALGIMRELGLRALEVNTLAAMAGSLEEQGDLAAAEGLREEVLSYYKAMESRGAPTAAAHVEYGALLARLGRVDQARSNLKEALAIATESGAPSERVMSLVRLALLEAGDPAEAVQAQRKHARRMEHGARMEASFLLYGVTGDKQHLEAAHDLLTFWVEHAPEKYRETTLANVRLHRDIMQAWSEQTAS